MDCRLHIGKLLTSHHAEHLLSSSGRQRGDERFEQVINIIKNIEGRLSEWAHKASYEFPPFGRRKTHSLDKLYSDIEEATIYNTRLDDQEKAKILLGLFRDKHIRFEVPLDNIFGLSLLLPLQQFGVKPNEKLCPGSETDNRTLFHISLLGHSPFGFFARMCFPSVCKLLSKDELKQEMEHLQDSPAFHTWFGKYKEALYQGDNKSTYKEVIVAGENVMAMESSLLSRLLSHVLTPT